MTLTAIVAIPENTDFASLSDEVQAVLNQLLVKWPTHKDAIDDAQVYGGKRVIIVHLNKPSDTPLAAIEAMLSNYSLDWDVHALQDFKTHTEIVDDEPTQVLSVYKTAGAALQPYLKESKPVTYDAEGNVLTWRKPTNSEIEQFAGAQPWDE